MTCYYATAINQKKHQSIRLVNYMNDERYRHLKITDKSGQSQYRDPVTGTFIDYQINLDKMVILL